MNSSRSQLPRGLKIGSNLTFITGAIPFLVGLAGFVCFISGVMSPDEPWRSGQLPYGPTDYTLTQIREFNANLGNHYPLAQHMQFANMANTGLVVMLLSIYGLRRRQKWSWWALLTMLLWVGVNDAIGLINAGQLPLPILPVMLGLVGLFLARSSIFEPSS